MQAAVDAATDGETPVVAGDNALVPPDINDGYGNAIEPTPLDLDIKARFVDDALAPNVGVGTPPLVDLGCYEHA